MQNNNHQSRRPSPVIIDGVALDLTYAAGAALRAAQAALDHCRTRIYEPEGFGSDESVQAAMDRIMAFDARAQLAESPIRNSMSDEEFALYQAELEPELQRQALIGHWAAAEANREDDPGLADAWTVQVRGAGIDVERARVTAAQHRESVWPPQAWTRIEQLATDYVEIMAGLGKRAREE